MLLVSQIWSFAGIGVRVGQPELVGTHVDYRGRGLVRAQFEVIHRWSAEHGHQLQAIAGIPWFYRQFGYELALPRGGGPFVHTSSLMPPPRQDPPAYRLRAMGEEDLGFAVELDAHAAERSLITVPRDAGLWRYELAGRSPGSALRQEMRIIESAEGDPVGFLTHAPRLNGARLDVTGWELKPGISWRAVWFPLLAYALATGETYASADGQARFSIISFWWTGLGHPVGRLIPPQGPSRPQAWYVRVPDVPAFLRAVAPVLERRLGESLLAGHTGELSLSFYRDGIRLVFERGRVVAGEVWQPSIQIPSQEWGMPSTDPRRAMAMFPGLSFLQLLFGFRSLEELEAAFPDCLVRTHEVRALLTALFPKQASDVWALA